MQNDDAHIPAKPPARCGTNCSSHQNQGGDCAARPMEHVTRGCYVPAPVTPAAVRAADELASRFLWPEEHRLIGHRIIAAAYAEQDETAIGVIALFRELDNWVGDLVQQHGAWQVFRRAIDRMEAAMKGTT